ncbi:MAG TPA: hypothetical protein VHU84_04100 [Lacipirellulaceae bacterium]|jgi:hypothetical protein|nr:hypothetical protein [Lacipirellulaceae bacterium]
MASGITSRTPSPAFHVDDSDESTNYHTFSVPAIISLILGLASPLCFGAPLLFAIPLAGCAIAIFALRRIAVSDGALAGRWAAVTGLILSAAMIVAPVSRAYALKVIRTHQAEEFARTWLEMVTSGHTDPAYHLTIDSLRGPAPTPPEQKTPPPDPYATFLDSPQVKALVAAGADAKIRLVNLVDYDAQTFPRVFVRQQYEITPAGSASDASPVNVTLTLERTHVAKEGRSRWLVFAIDDGTKPMSTPSTQ